MGNYIQVLVLRTLVYQLLLPMFCPLFHSSHSCIWNCPGYSHFCRDWFASDFRITLHICSLWVAHSRRKILCIILNIYRLLRRAKRMIATDVRKTADAPNLTSRPEWRISRVPEAKAPSDLTITHINQSYNLWVSIESTHSLLLLSDTHWERYRRLMGCRC